MITVTKHNPGLKVWHWFTASVVWLAIVVAWAFDFHERRLGGFGVEVPTGKYLPPTLSLALASMLLYVILCGVCDSNRLDVLTGRACD